MSGNSLSLSARWELRSTLPNAFADPAALRLDAGRWIDATVPSTVAGTLRAAGQWTLDMPPLRFDAHDWWYRTSFAPAWEAGCPASLRFDGLATLAEVWLDGRRILTSNNMFLSQRCAVGALHATANELVICFRSLDAALAQRRARPRWRAPMVDNQQLRWIRTTLLGRTPGWSPPAAAVGPWRGVFLEKNPSPQLEETQLTARMQDGDGWVTFECAVAAAPAYPWKAHLIVSLADAEQCCELRPDSTGRLQTRLRIARPELWWPHTHGTPALYRASVRITAGDEAPIEMPLGEFGFRSVSLDTGDEGFAIYVNGVRIFCRGACWTPIDPVGLQATPDQYAQVLEQLTAAGMNMLRVGGTMVYEADEFYDQCDRRGILVWQDFMFANMDYPQTDLDFAASITLEAQQTLARLRGHPCLALLCGNSEVEQQAAMWGAPRSLWQPAMFHQLLAELSHSLCPDIPYWPSSAHGGAFPHAVNSGTASYYGVGAYLRDLHDARRSEVRFATECLAIANYPEDATLAQMPGGHAVRCHDSNWKSRSPRDLGAGWDFDDVRDHYLRQLFKLDPAHLRYTDYGRYCMFSRVVSGEVMSAVFNEWRRRRSTCSGGLIWFLRDLWPGAGWGIIGSDGTPKAAYFYLRRALQPLALCFSDEGVNGPAIHVANDSAQALSGTLELTLYRADGQAIVRTEHPLSIPARDVVEWAAAASFEEFHDLSYAYRFGPPAYDVAHAVLRSPERASLAQAHYLPHGLARERVELGLSACASADDGDGDGYTLLLRSRLFAQAVTVEVDGYRCDDQFFNMTPGAVVQLRLVRSAAPKPRTLRGTVRALNAIGVTPIDLSA